MKLLTQRKREPKLRKQLPHNMSDMESLNKQEIGFLKEQINDLKREMTAGFAKLEAKLEILTEGYVRKDEFHAHCEGAKDLYVTKVEFAPVKKSD